VKLILASFYLLSAYNLFAQAVPPDVAQRRILALESAWSQAEAAKDASALSILLAPEAMFVDYDGSLMNREAFLKSMQAPSASIAHITNESVTVRLFGAIAIVNGIYRKSGVRDGKHFRLRARFMDTWMQHGESWVCVASQSTLISHEQLP
jgi:ketosteroid isomerase-like protein